MTGPVLYVGAHQPHWLWRVTFPLFVSHRQRRQRGSGSFVTGRRATARAALARRPRQLRPASCRWALDSGGFTELSLHGRWVTPAEDYAAAVAVYAERIGGLDLAAPQDWMCELWITGRTGLSVRDHLERTVASYLDLRRLAPGLPFIPVVQGWRLADYLRCTNRGHPDYAGEVDHAALITRLSGYDGWALSTSAATLPTVLALCRPGVRVAAWHRGERATPSRWPLNAWEPVIYSGGRPADPSRGYTRRIDSLVCGVSPLTTLPGRVIGAKPAAFCRWIFDLLGATPGDSLDDLFPGSGAVGRAWTVFTGSAQLSRGPGADASQPARADASLDEALHDASRLSATDATAPTLLEVPA